jgi:hypothetical protein
LKSFYQSPSKGAVKDQMSFIWAADQLGYKPAERAALRLICLYFRRVGGAQNQWSIQCTGTSWGVAYPFFCYIE